MVGIFKMKKSFHRLLFKQGGQRAAWEYPFAVAGINITFMLIQMLDLYSGWCSDVSFILNFNMPYAHNSCWVCWVNSSYADKPRCLPGVNFVRLLGGAVQMKFHTHFHFPFLSLSLVIIKSFKLKDWLVSDIMDLCCFMTKHSAEDEAAFDVLYCIAFELMDAQWLAMHASYMEFNVPSLCQLPTVWLSTFTLSIIFLSWCSCLEMSFIGFAVTKCHKSLSSPLSVEFPCFRKLYGSRGHNWRESCLWKMSTEYKIYLLTTSCIGNLSCIPFLGPLMQNSNYGNISGASEWQHPESDSTYASCSIPSFP